MWLSSIPFVLLLGSDVFTIVRLTEEMDSRVVSSVPVPGIERTQHGDVSNVDVYNRLDGA